MTDDWEPQVRDPGRIAALERSGLIGLFGDHAFDRLLELAVAVTGAPRGVIALVDAEHTTAISGFGFPEGLPLFAPVDFSFCRFVVARGQPFLVEDALNDPRTIGDPAIDAFKAVAWIGYPITDSEGNVLGNFCLMDSEPREWTPDDIQAVGTLAEAASTEIALRAARAEAAAARPAGSTSG
jgi:sigma-B regulation protein RsbU (phosphoserine phosphatase)